MCFGPAARIAVQRQHYCALESPAVSDFVVVTHISAFDSTRRVPKFKVSKQQAHCGLTITSRISLNVD